MAGNLSVIHISYIPSLINRNNFSCTFTSPKHSDRKSSRPQLANTVWSQLEPGGADVDFETLEDEFAAKQTRGLLPAGAAQQKAKHTMLLPLQRAQNVGVFLTKLKMSPAQVHHRLLIPSSHLCVWYKGSVFVPYPWVLGTQPLHADNTIPQVTIFSGTLTSA